MQSSWGKSLSGCAQRDSGLQGKVLDQDADADKIKGQFDKKIHGKVLGDRSQILFAVARDSPDQSTAAIEAYPIN
ncbi:hypothetical protein ACFLV7_07785 [Chloroflexota bacterium]